MPSGHLYAALMRDGITFDEYQSLIDILKGNNLIYETGNMLSITAHGKEIAAKVNSILYGERAD
jgi:hypothetical protein